MRSRTCEARGRVACIEIGRRVGPLRVEEEIGRGAFGRVYRAYDEMIQRYVALKVLPTDGPDRGLVTREIRVLGQLNHPHVVTLHRVHRLGDQWVLEMELVEGMSLDERIEAQGRLSAGTARAVARAVISALAAVHGKGLLHRDVKPANVLLGHDGSIKLADFGVGALHQSQAAMDEELVGTPQFLAPELIEGHSATCASDVWSFGVLLFHALSGRPPFETGSLRGLFEQIRSSVVPALPSGCAVDLASLVSWCLHRDPARRPPSAAIAALMTTSRPWSEETRRCGSR